MPKIIKDIQDKGIKVIALTGGYGGPISFVESMEDLRLKTLKEFDIDLSNAFLLKEMKFDSLVKDPGKPVPVYKNGVILTSKYPKAYVLENFLHQLNFKPKKIIFVDNDIKHIKDLKEFSAKIGANYIGIHYTKMDKNIPQAFDAALAQKKLEFLKANNVWLSDDEAKAMNVP